MDNNQFSPPSKQQIKSPNYIASKIPLMILILLLITFFLAVIVIAFSFLTKENNTSLTDSRNKTVADSSVIDKASSSAQTQNKETNTTEEENPRFIVYLKDNNVWSVKSDGTSLRQITRDGDGNNIRYLLPKFISNNKIGFIRCLKSPVACTLLSKDLITNQEKEELKREQEISCFVINDQGDTIYYSASDDKGVTSLYYFHEGENKKLYDFVLSLGRGGNLSDEQSLSLSENNQYLLVVNTFTQPSNNQDKTTVWLFGKEGKIVTSIGRGATDAFFDSVNSFIYRLDNLIMKKTFSGQEQELAIINGYDIDLIKDKDGERFLYWNEGENGITKTFYYSIKNKESFPIQENLISPSWLNNQEIVAIKTVQDSDSYFGFTNQGLVVFNIETKDELLLDSGSTIYNFTLN